MLELVDKTTKDAELREKFSYHGEEMECVFLATNWAGRTKYHAFTLNRAHLGQLPMKLTGNDATLELFRQVGIEYDEKRNYGFLDLNGKGVSVIVIHDENDNKPRIQTVKYAGKMAQLEAKPKQEGSVENPATAIAATESPAPETVTISYNFTGELPDTLPELLALLRAISDKLFKMWEKEPAPDKRQAREFGNINMKRVALSRIFQEIDMLIRMMHIRGELKRKKD